jgi:ethanolamine permease
MISFILLRRRWPDIERPYRSPFGVPGAVVTLVIALACLVGLFVVDPIYTKVVLGTLVWYLLGLAYFAFHARHRLVYSPEEAFAEGEAVDAHVRHGEPER